jgi:hypothetical protein
MMLALGAVAEGTAPLPLRRYEGGGVANSPQLALFGEGKNPEAYVPLPDGRSIPVSIDAPKAPGFAGPVAATFVNSPQVIVNVLGGAGSPQDYQALAAKIGKEIETHARALFTQELRRQMRPGGMLYR